MKILKSRLLKIIIILPVLGFLVWFFAIKKDKQEYNWREYNSPASFKIDFPGDPFISDYTNRIGAKQIDWQSASSYMVDDTLYSVDYSNFIINNEPTINEIREILNILLYEEGGNFNLVKTSDGYWEYYKIDYNNDETEYSFISRFYYLPEIQAFYHINVTYFGGYKNLREDYNSKRFLNSFSLPSYQIDSGLVDNLFEENNNLKEEIQKIGIENKNYINSLNKKIDSANNKNINTKPQIISEWSYYTVFLKCYFGDYISIGSGLMSSGSIITNMHVIFYEEDNSIFRPYQCDIFLDNNIYEEVYFYDEFSETNEVGYYKDFDIGIIKFQPKNQEIKKRLYDSPASLRCKLEEMSIGDEVLILGYPSIGSSQTITVTDGIISGYEDFYYLTSAKIDQGNSGGVAVSVKDNCYLGIPTFSVLGSIESLGRILDADTVFNYIFDSTI